MDKTIKILTVVLAAQVVLAAGLDYGHRRLAPVPSDTPLFKVDSAQVDHVLIEGSGKAKVELAKKDGKWTLSNPAGFPADAQKVDGLIDKLVALDHGAPVTTSSSAEKRFKVADDDFERRITLAAGSKTLAQLYVGDSPSMHEVHARPAKEDSVYSIKFASYDAPVKTTDWEDKTILEIPPDKIQAIDVAGLHLQHQPAAATPKPAAAPTTTPTASVNANGQVAVNGLASGQAGAAKTPAAPQWTATGAGDLARFSAGAADKLAQQLADLRFRDVLGTAPKPEYGMDHPVLNFRVVRQDGSEVDYTLARDEPPASAASAGPSAQSKAPPPPEQYTLKVSTRPEYFALDSAEAKSLLADTATDSLLSAKPAPAATPPKSAKAPTGQAAGKGASGHA